MPPTPPPLAIALMLTILGTIVGAWIWVILQLAFRLPVLPPNTPRLVPWGGRSVLAAFGFWFVISMGVPTVYRSIHGPGPVAPQAEGPSKKLELKPAEMMTFSAVVNAATLALVPLFLAAICRARPRDFGLADPNPLEQVRRGILLYPLLAPVVFGAMGVSLLIWGRDSHPLEKAMGEDRSPGMVSLLVLAGVVLAPMAEELIFRGILLGWLTRIALKPNRPDAMESEVADPVPTLAEERPHLVETIEIESLDDDPSPIPPETVEQVVLNPYTAPAASIALPASEPTEAPLVARPLPLLAGNVIVSLIFASLHAAVWPTPIPIFFLSLGLGFLYQRTGSLIGPIALHMTFNGVSTTLMFLIVGNNPAPEPTDPVPPPAAVAFEHPASF